MSEKREIVYNKLVRDKIPEIIEKSGKAFTARTLDDAEYLEMLDRKLYEETNEYVQARNLEELCDILEVLFESAKALGYTEDDLLNERMQKRTARGGFEKRIFLEKVIEQT